MKKIIKKILTTVLIIFFISLCLLSCHRENLQIKSSSKNIQQIIDIYPSIDLKTMTLNTDEIFNKVYPLIRKIELDSLIKESNELKKIDGIETQIVGKQKINNHYFLLIKIIHGDWITYLKLLSFDQNFTLKKSYVLLYNGGGDEESDEPFVYRQIGQFLNDSIFQIQSFEKIYTDSSEVMLSPKISNKIIYLK